MREWSIILSPTWGMSKTFGPLKQFAHVLLSFAELLAGHSISLKQNYYYTLLFPSSCNFVSFLAHLLSSIQCSCFLKAIVWFVLQQVWNFGRSSGQFYIEMNVWQIIIIVIVKVIKIGKCPEIVGTGKNIGHSIQ